MGLYIPLPIVGKPSFGEGFSTLEKIFSEEYFVLRDKARFNPIFDETICLGVLKFLHTSPFSLRQCSVGAYKSRVRTPTFLASNVEGVGKDRCIVYYLRRCKGQRLYELMVGSGGELDLPMDSVEDFSENDPQENNPIISFNQPITLREIMTLRRKGAVLLYNSLNDFFTDTTIGSIYGTSDDTTLFDYSRGKRVADVQNRCKEIDSLCDWDESLIFRHFFVAEVMCEFQRLASPRRNLAVDYSIEDLLPLSELISPRITDDKGLVIFHDDNNKNVIVGPEIETGVPVTYYIDFHKIFPGLAKGNWYSQIVYPGQYGDWSFKQPISNSSESQEKRVTGVKEQLSGYYGAVGVKPSVDDLIETYALFAKHSFRDWSLFIRRGNVELAQGFCLHAIDCLAILENSTHSPSIQSLRKKTCDIYTSLYNGSAPITDRDVNL